mgnify:CR=1 FL=1
MVEHTVTAPVSLIVSAFATLDDVRGTLTPQLRPVDSTLILVDLGHGRMRMGGSMLAQVLGRFGHEVPDLDDAQLLKSLVAAVNALRAQGHLLAYHDRSDGGLWAAVCEMAFAGHVGVSLNVDLLVTEGDGIADSRAEYGDSKNWATQVSARRHELTLKALFSEELGVVLQVPTAVRNEVMQTLRAHGLSKHSHFVGKTNDRGVVEVVREDEGAHRIAAADLTEKHRRNRRPCQPIGPIEDRPIVGPLPVREFAGNERARQELHDIIKRGDSARLQQGESRSGEEEEQRKEEEEFGVEVREHADAARHAGYAGEYERDDDGCGDRRHEPGVGREAEEAMQPAGYGDDAGAQRRGKAHEYGHERGGV